MTSALVLDGEQRAALAVARSLARQGLRVEAASAKPAPMAGISRRVVGSQCYPAPEQSASKFVAWLNQHTPTTIVPVTDATTMLVRARTALDDDGYEQLTDKAALMELAAARSVPIPRGSVVTSVPDAADAAARLGFPVILKPARSKMLMGDRIASTTVRRAENAAELRQLLEVAPWFPQLPVIVQEFVPGYGAGVFCLYDRDHALAWFAHRRLREKPPSGGVSVLCESVPVDPRLREHAESLLRAARYRGVAMVEFRIGDDGRPYIMEVNARFWGSLQLAIDCGVDFPWLYYQMMMNAPVVPVTDYAVGRRLRWLLGDLDNLLIQLREPSLQIVGKLGALRRFAATTFDCSCRQEIFRWSDPAPAFLEARQWLAATMGRLS